VTATLQPQRSVILEAQGRIRTIELLLDYHEFAPDLRERDRLEILVARLQARGFEVRSPRIFH